MRTRTPANTSTTEDLMSRLQNSLSNLNTETALQKTKEVMQQTGKKILSISTQEITDLATNQNVPNYKVSAASSMLFALLYMTSSLEGGYFSSYLSLLGCAGSAALAAEQFGVNNILNVGKSASSVFFFKPKEKAADVELAEPEHKIKKTM